MLKGIPQYGSEFGILPWPPSVNHYWLARGRGQGRRLSEAARIYRSQVLACVLALRPALRDADTALYEQPVCVALEFAPPDRRRRDLDNLAKAPLDALTHARVWWDDCQVRELLLGFLAPCPPKGYMRAHVWPLKDYPRDWIRERGNRSIRHVSAPGSGAGAGRE